MELEYLEIGTMNGTFLYNGEDATAVYDSITVAAQSGAEWSPPTTVDNNASVVFVLKNIASIYYRLKE